MWLAHRQSARVLPSIPVLVNLVRAPWSIKWRGIPATVLCGEVILALRAALTQ